MPPCFRSTFPVMLASMLVAWVCFLAIPSAQAQLRGLERLSTDVTPTRYRLEFEINPRAERFSGIARIDLRLDAATQTISLHGRGLEVSKAQLQLLDGTEISGQYAEDGETGNVSLTLARAVQPGKATLIIAYSAPFNTNLVGLNKVKEAAGEQVYAYTQFEPLYARRAFPGFDEPRFKTPFEVSIIVHGNDTAVANGPEVRTTRLDDERRRIDFAPTKPIPTYLVALAVGEFDVVTWDDIPPNAVRKHPLPLRGIAPKGKGKQFNYALKHTAEMLAILEEYFDSPYPYAKLDLLAAEASNSSGMENVGLILYRQDRVLLGDNPSTWQLRGFASIHAHELAHMWFGNLVTPAWWDDLWLNEAFATWMADKVSHAWRPDTFDQRGGVRRMGWAKWTDRLTTARKIRQPIRNEGDIASAFDGITYGKGGSVLSMIERDMGEEAFRAGIQQFMRKNAHGVATAEDFFAAMADAADNPGIIDAFRSFVDQPGLPRIAVDWSCDASGAATVNLAQSRHFPLGSTGNAARTWSVPLCLVYDDDGKRQDQCLLFRKAEQEIKLPSRTCPSTIMPNRNGVGYVTFTLPKRGWTALIEQLHELHPSEALAVMGSVRDAFDAGLISTANAMRAATSAAKSVHWDVVSAPIQMLRDIKLTVAPADLRQEVIRTYRNMYRSALQKIDLSDEALAKREPDQGRAILRGDVLWFMALDADDPDLSERLSRAGQRYVGFGSDRQLHPEALDPDLVRLALTAASRDLGLPFIDHLIALFRQSRDPVFRGHVVNAIAFPTTVEANNRVFELILDPTIAKRDASWLLGRIGRRLENRDRLYDWLTANYDEIIERIPSSHRRWIPWRASAFCDPASREKVAAFFGERVKALHGGPRQLGYVLEGIDVCAAIAKAQRPGAVAYFSK